MKKRIALPKLSVQQDRVLKMLCDGFKSAEVAELMGIRPGTVKIHARRAKKALLARTLTQAAYLYGKGGK